MKVFFFGLGYCARRLIQREPWIEASGTARTAEAVAAQRREGVEAWRFDGVEADRGLEQALSQAEAIVVSIPPRDGPGAALERFAAAIAAAPGLRRIVYYSTIGVYGDHGGELGRRDERDPDPHRARPRRLEDEAKLDSRGPGARGRKLTSCASPGSTGRAAMRSSICARGRRAASSSRGRCSTARMSTTSLEISRLVLTRNLKGQIWNVADEEPAPPQEVVAYAAALLGLEPPPEEPFDEARLSPMAREFYADNKRVSIAKAKAMLGFEPAYPTYREGLKALAEAGEGRRRLKRVGRHVPTSGFGQPGREFPRR